jgi:RNA polymerase sigma factor (sigma-70 family)
MWSRGEGDNAFIKRLLPSTNRSRQDRAQAWNEWQYTPSGTTVRKFIRAKNYSPDPDEDIFQETLTTAYQEVERGRYEPRDGVPFAAYVKGIARNKIREAHRRSKRYQSVNLDDVEFALADSPRHQPENAYEYARKRDHLYDGMAQLPIGRRQVLERILRGQQTSEIAQAMEISEDLVRQHKSRGLRFLRKIVAD